MGSSCCARRHVATGPQSADKPAESTSGEPVPAEDTLGAPAPRYPHLLPANSPSGGFYRRISSPGSGALRWRRFYLTPPEHLWELVYTSEAPPGYD